MFSFISKYSYWQKISVTEIFSDTTSGPDGKTPVSIKPRGIQQYYHVSETEIEVNEKKSAVATHFTMLLTPESLWLSLKQWLLIML